MFSLIALILLSGLRSNPAIAHDSSNTIVSIPQSYTYLLPNGFTGNSNYTFVNGTSTSDDSINNLFDAAKNAPFISYDDEFLDMLGPNPEVTLVAEREDDYFAYEMGVWVPERNELWFTSAVRQARTHKPTLYSLNLETNAIHEVQTSQPIINPNGGYYFEGKVYIATYNNNQSYSGGIISVDVNTLEVETALNSYYGLRFNGLDDLVWVTDGDYRYLYFTDFNFAYLGFDNLPPLQLPANVYRYDPQTNVVLPIIGRNDINPNGVRVSPDMKTLYVTDSDPTFFEAAPYSPASGPANTFWYGPYIFAYDLDSNMMPVNRRMFGMARQGIADGIHVDDAGRVYTGEWEGIVVRNPAGKIIGVFNSQFFQADKSADALPIANLGLAGDVVVVLSTTRLWTVKVAQNLLSRDSPILK